MGSGKGDHWCSFQKNPDTLGFLEYKYYVLHLSNELFPRNIGDLEVVKNFLFSLMLEEVIDRSSQANDPSLTRVLPSISPY